MSVPHRSTEPARPHPTHWLLSTQVERMLTRAFNEIKGCFQEAFCPAQGDVCETADDLPKTKQVEVMRELLAVYAVCTADLTHDDVLRLSAPRRVPVDTRD